MNEILDEFNLRKAKNQRASSLSGGQQRRLNICMSLFGEPKFCVLDEPTTGVDPVSRREIWTALKRRVLLNEDSSERNDRVMFFTTHFMDEADYLAGTALY